MAIVLITVYIMGGTTEAALNKLKIPTGVDEEQYMAERLREPVIPNVMRNFGENEVDDYRALDCYFFLLNPLFNSSASSQSKSTFFLLLFETSTSCKVSMEDLKVFRHLLHQGTTRLPIFRMWK